METADAVALDPAACEIDVGTFEQLVAAGTPTALVSAAALYTGEFLAGLSAQSASVEEWLLTERERLRELALQALARLLSQQLRSEPLGPAVQTAIHLLTLDPAQEPVHRTLMRLYLRQGRRAAALRQYQLCITTLHREFGVEPEAETRALYQEILRAGGAREGQRRLTANPAALRAPGFGRDALAGDTPLIGRKAELETLREAFEAARNGRGVVIVVQGEAGVGKTRLLGELAAGVWASDGVVLVGRAFETTQILSFGPWVDALRGGSVIQDEVLVGGLGQGRRAELARLFPELGHASTPISPDNAARLFEAVTRLLTDVAARAPVLLLLEDLHWADEMSLRLLAFVARRLGSIPLALVVTAREEELGTSSLLAQVVDELRREESLQLLPVTALSPDGTAALVRSLARSGRTPVELQVLTDQVWKVSEGNPFVAVETIRSLEQDPVLLPTGLVPLPERVRTLIDARLNRLSPIGRELAAVAAVIGRTFPFSLLYRAAGLSDREAAKGMEELVRQRILHSVGDQFHFIHDRVWTVAYARLIEPRRGALHAAVADAFEGLYSDRLDTISDRLSFHYSRTDRAEKATFYLARSAEQAARVYDHKEAVALLREALAHVPRLAGSAVRDRTRVELALRLAASLYSLGSYRESVDLLLPEAQYVAQLGDASLAGRYHFWLSHMFTRLNQHSSAVRSASLAIAEGERCGDTVTMGKAYGVLAVEAYWAGDSQRSIELGQRGIALLEGTGEQWWLGMGLFYLGISHLLIGEVAEALQIETRVRTIGEAISDPHLQSRGLHVIGWALAMQRDGAAAVAACQQSLGLAPDPVARIFSTGVLGYVHVEQADPDRAIPLLEQVVDVLGHFRALQWQAWFLAVLAEAHRLAGTSDRARELSGRGLDVAREAGNRYAIGWAQRTLGRLALSRAAWLEAEDHLGRAIETFTAIAARFEVARTYLDLAELAHARRDVDSAATHLEHALEIFTALHVKTYVERAMTYAATIGLSQIRQGFT